MRNQGNMIIQGNGEFNTKVEIDGYEIPAIKKVKVEYDPVKKPKVILTLEPRNLVVDTDPKNKIKH